MLGKCTPKVVLFGRGWGRILIVETRSDLLNLNMEHFRNCNYGLSFCWVETVMYLDPLANCFCPMSFTKLRFLGGSYLDRSLLSTCIP